MMLHEFQKTSGGAHVDVASHLEELSLVLVAYSAVEDADVEALNLGAEDHGIVGDLLGKFTCGSDYQAGRSDSLLLVAQIFLQKRYDVHGCLAASCLGLNHDIGPFDGDGKNLLLDRHA